MKHLYLMFLVVCMASWQATYAAETEPNNTTAQANTLAVNNNTTAKIGSAGDVDWWKVTITDGKLNVKLTPALRKGLWLYIYDNNGTTLLSSASSDSAFTQSVDGLAAGTYFIKVVAVKTTDTANYQISNSVTTPSQANDAEPNNSKTQAAVLALNSSKTGHVGYYYNGKRDTADWYKLTTTSDGKLRLKLAPANGQYLNVSLYANNGTSLISTSSGKSAFSMITDGLKKDVYYVKINAKTSTGFAPYTLADSMFKPSTDSFILATNFAYKNKISKGGKADWWKITTTKNGKLTFTLTPVSKKYVWVYLYDHNRTTVLNSSYSNAKFVQATDGLAAGTYYAKVVPYYATDTATYVVADTLTTPSQANDTEPNNSKAQAITFAPNSSKTGHVGYLYNGKRDTTDWYKITTTGDGLLKLKLTPANGSYAWIYLYDNNGNTLINSAYSNAAFTLATDGLAAGTYYVRVNCYYSSNFAPYTISNSLTPPAEANDAEANNTKAQAVTFGPNSSKTGHVGYYYNNKRDTADWYKITTTTDGMLKLNLTPVNGSYAWIYLYDNDGTTLINSSYSNAAFSLSTDGLAAGTYYVRVNCYYNTNFTPYTLSNTLTTYSFVTDAEPNRRPYQGKVMAANSTVTGHVNFYYNKTRDSLDWWKFAYTGSGTLKFTFNLATHKIDGSIPYVWFYVYKDTSGTPIYSNYFNTASNVINLSSLAKTNYYIKVVPYYAKDFVAYSISNGTAAALTSVTEAPIERLAVPEENLNTRSRATVFPNPASTQLRITTAKGLGVSTIVLKYASGKPVWHIENSTLPAINVDVSRFASGTYFLTITSKNGTTSTHKVVIAR